MADKESKKWLDKETLEKVLKEYQKFLDRMVREHEVMLVGGCMRRYLSGTKLELGDVFPIRASDEDIKRVRDNHAQENNVKVSKDGLTGKS